MKTTIKIVLFLFVTTFTFGQTPQEKKDKIKALKVAYITEKLDLTTEEAQKFWPVYNAFDEKEFELRHSMKKEKFKKLNDEGFEKLSEKEAESLLNQFEINNDELYTLRKKYMTDLRKILSAKKIILLKKTEDEFNRKLLREFRDRKSKK